MKSSYDVKIGGDKEAAAVLFKQYTGQAPNESGEYSNPKTEQIGDVDINLRVSNPNHVHDPLYARVDRSNALVLCFDPSDPNALNNLQNDINSKTNQNNNFPVVLVGVAKAGEQTNPRDLEAAKNFVDQQRNVKLFQLDGEGKVLDADGKSVEGGVKGIFNHTAKEIGISEGAIDIRTSQPGINVLTPEPSEGRMSKLADKIKTAFKDFKESITNIKDSIKDRFSSNKSSDTPVKAAELKSTPTKETPTVQAHYQDHQDMKSYVEQEGAKPLSQTGQRPNPPSQQGVQGQGQNDVNFSAAVNAGTPSKTEGVGGQQYANFSQVTGASRGEQYANFSQVTGASRGEQYVNFSAALKPQQQTLPADVWKAAAAAGVEFLNAQKPNPVQQSDKQQSTQTRGSAATPDSTPPTGKQPSGGMQK